MYTRTPSWTKKIKSINEVTNSDGIDKQSYGFYKVLQTHMFICTRPREAIGGLCIQPSTLYVNMFILFPCSS